MNIRMSNDHLSETENLTDNVNIAIRRYAKHPGIEDIWRLVTIKTIFLSIKWRMKKAKCF